MTHFTLSLITNASIRSPMWLKLREAHGLKGSSSNPGAKHLAEKCADLEAEASSLSFDTAVRRVNELEACWIELQPVFLWNKSL